MYNNSIELMASAQYHRVIVNGEFATQSLEAPTATPLTIPYSTSQLSSPPIHKKKHEEQYHQSPSSPNHTQKRRRLQAQEERARIFLKSMFVVKFVTNTNDAQPTN